MTVHLSAIICSSAVHHLIVDASAAAVSVQLGVCPRSEQCGARALRGGGPCAAGRLSVTKAGSPDLIAALDEAPLGRFHLRAVVVSGMGFFTDAYDLFIIGIASALISKDWHLSSGRLALLNSTMLAAAFLGAFVFGRFADLAGRKRVYWMVAAIMIVGSVGSALATTYWVLIGFRFLLGFGVGGDYPVSAVLMSEYANRKDRGKLVGMVFATQALGLIVGPLIALALLGAGVSDNLAWRIMLGLGALPAAGVIYLRSRMPESPRYQIHVQGNAEQAANQIAEFTGGQVNVRAAGAVGPTLGLRAFLTNRRYLTLLAGTAGTWFLLDYAYYGNTISTPQILSLIAPHASTMTKIALQLAIFVIAALPGYLLAIAWLDRIGHRRLQLVGFTVMAACFALLAVVPGMTTMVGPFLLVYGVSYFFTEFGPNMTTFVIPSEVYPVAMRATGHGISAGIGKLGAFIGVFLFPILQTSLGLRGTLMLTAAVSVLGVALTRVLPEPSGASLEDISPQLGDPHRADHALPASRLPATGATARQPARQALDRRADQAAVALARRIRPSIPAHEGEVRPHADLRDHRGTRGGPQQERLGEPETLADRPTR
jgi:MFS transporter, PHS family, inorganic phosphate transporter